MTIDLMPWMIGWAVVTTGVVALFVWRVLVANQEPGALHVVESEQEQEQETRLATKLARIDLWGKTLTVVSALLILAIGLVWVYSGWLKAQP